jgi:hypothetical protein
MFWRLESNEEATMPMLRRALSTRSRKIMRISSSAAKPARVCDVKTERAIAPSRKSRRGIIHLAE